jgi:hypothetical protein
MTGNLVALRVGGGATNLASLVVAIYEAGTSTEVLAAGCCRMVPGWCSVPILLPLHLRLEMESKTVVTAVATAALVEAAVKVEAKERVLAVGKKVVAERMAVVVRVAALEVADRVAAVVMEPEAKKV